MLMSSVASLMDSNTKINLSLIIFYTNFHTLKLCTHSCFYKHIYINDNLLYKNGYIQNSTGFWKTEVKSKNWLCLLYSTFGNRQIPVKEVGICYKMY